MYRRIAYHITRSYLSLEGDTVIVRGPTPAGFKEREYFVTEIESVTFGERMGGVGRSLAKLGDLGVPHMDAYSMLRDAMAGRMSITTTSGRCDSYNRLNSVFELDSLMEFATALSQRGVPVCSSAR